MLVIIFYLGGVGQWGSGWCCRVWSRAVCYMQYVTKYCGCTDFDNNYGHAGVFTTTKYAHVYCVALLVHSVCGYFHMPQIVVAVVCNQNNLYFQN